MKRQALAAGATIHYKSRVKEEDCTIIACGPKGTSAVAYGEIFKTSHANHIAFQLNDKLAPGAYSYLIIVDGVGLICTCLWRKQSKSERFLNETIAWYEKHYPNLDRTPIKRVGGKGDFTINQRYKQDGRYYVGESGGLQDFMWGFGMRMAVWSGVLAAKDILGECDYEVEVRKQLLPYVRTSVANRWLMNRVGDGMFKRMCRKWMKDQKKRGDGLVWIGKLFRPRWYKTLLYHMVTPFMLKKIRRQWAEVFDVCHSERRKQEMCGNSRQKLPPSVSSGMKFDEVVARFRLPMTRMRRAFPASRRDDSFIMRIAFGQI